MQIARRLMRPVTNEARPRAGFLPISASAMVGMYLSLGIRHILGEKMFVRRFGEGSVVDVKRRDAFKRGEWGTLRSRQR